MLSLGCKKILDPEEDALLESAQYPGQAPDGHAMSCVAAVILLVVVIIKLNTALIVQKNGEESLVADGHAVALHYVRGGAIFTDLLTIAPTMVQVGCNHHT